MLQDVLKKIEAARPELIELSSKEIAALAAYVATHKRQRIVLSRLQRDPSYRQQVDAEKVAWDHVKCVLRFNQKLAAAEQPTDPHSDPTDPPTATTPTTKSRKGGRPQESDLAFDQQIDDAWQTGRYTKYADLARAMDLTADQVRTALDRHRHRHSKRL